MRLPDVPEDLGSKAYLVIILRLLVDGHGRLVRGEAVEASGARSSRFSRWREVPRVLRLLVAANVRGDRSLSGPPPGDASDSEAGRDYGD